MRFPLLRIVLLLSLFAIMIGCASENAPDQPQTQAEPEDDGPETELIFRGRYYLSKECREGKAELGLGMQPTCEIEEVLQGELKLKELKGFQRLENGKDFVVYTFRWRISARMEKWLRKVEEAGYEVVWLKPWDVLEIIDAEKPAPRNKKAELP
jgi:hypothetical protein